MPPATDVWGTMSRISEAGPQSALTDALRCLTHPRRRRIVAALEEFSATVSVRELADELRRSGTDDRFEDHEWLRTSLRHEHLPKLSQVALVDWNEADGTVSLADSPLWNDVWFRQLLEADSERWDAVGAVWGDECRHAALAVLADHEGPMTHQALAYAVLERRADGEISTAAIDTCAVALHHHHLPKLERAGFVGYDAETGVAVATMGNDVPLDDAVHPTETGRGTGA